MTHRQINYSGSLGLGKAIMKAAGLFSGEMVQVINCDNGERFETYLITEEKDNAIALYGGAALKAHDDDELIIMATAYLTPAEMKRFKGPKVVWLQTGNKLKK